MLIRFDFVHPHDRFVSSNQININKYTTFNLYFGCLGDVLIAVLSIVVVRTISL